MLISKFDLYKTEWLDLVFDDRNKEYGAYELRRNYDRTLVRAMAATFLSVAILCALSVILRTKPVHAVPPQTHTTVVTLTPVDPVIVHPKRAPAPAPHRPPQAIKTTQYTQMVVTDDQHAVTPPVIAKLGNIGPTTNNNGTEIDPGPIEAAPSRTGNSPVVDNTVHENFGLDVMPSPVGGEGAWAKFLSKNLRFPGPAQEEGLSGRVILSFIIEKDGSLSNIVVERGAGHGFDEEALRVLKLAKAWKPGMQNGQPVRVKYDIPINFQLSQE